MKHSYIFNVEGKWQMQWWSFPVHPGFQSSIQFVWPVFKLDCGPFKTKCDGIKSSFPYTTFNKYNYL